MAPDISPAQRDKFLKSIEKIELADRPEKWRLIKKFTFDLKPWLKDEEAAHSEACKELRQKNENKYAASKSGTMRETMKLYNPVYQNLIRLDPELSVELSGRVKDADKFIGKQLWDAFPEWRISRTY